MSTFAPTMFKTTQRDDGAYEVALVTPAGDRKVMAAGTKDEINMYRRGYADCAQVMAGIVEMMTPDSGFRP